MKLEPATVRLDPSTQSSEPFTIHIDEPGTAGVFLNSALNDNVHLERTLQLTPDFDRIMSGEPSTELPTHYGGKTTDGAIVQRPNEESALAPLASPTRAYYRERQRALSPERTPVDGIFSDFEGPRASVRQRTSVQPLRERRMSNSDDRHNFSSSRESQRVLRSRDDYYYRDRDDERERDGYRRESSDRSRDRDHDDLGYHPDSQESRRRPPRAYRNGDRYTKAFYEDRREEPRRQSVDEESLDGYNYDMPKTPKNAIFDFSTLTKEQQAQILNSSRLPYTRWMSSSFKNHFVATMGEFVGTTMFLFFAFAGTQVANIGSVADAASASTAGTTSGAATGFNISVLLYISVIFGFSLMVNVWVFFRISGGLFNPAVTLAMFLTGAVPVTRALCLFVAQMAGSVAASAIVTGLFPTSFNVRTTLAGETSLVQGVFIEAILTAELVFTIFMLAKEKHKATFIAPVGIGLALFIAEMVGVYYTGGSLNPARSFGPCAVTWTWDSEHWIYWVGPIIGSLIAVFFYKFIKMLEYEMANPGQDGDVVNDPTKNKEKLAEVRSESRAA